MIDAAYAVTVPEFGLVRPHKAFFLSPSKLKPFIIRVNLREALSSF
jgi:hypothetical protein